MLNDKSFSDAKCANHCFVIKKPIHLNRLPYLVTYNLFALCTLLCAINFPLLALSRKIYLIATYCQIGSTCSDPLLIFSYAILLIHIQLPYEYCYLLDNYSRRPKNIRSTDGVYFTERNVTLHQATSLLRAVRGLSQTYM